MIPNRFVLVYHSEKKTTVSSEEDDSIDSDSQHWEAEEDNDDLITLTGCDQITQWRFPKDLKKCPVQNCTLQFKTRSTAIVHYKKQHAMDAVLCSICDKPISTKHRETFTKHYSRMHPNVVPFEFEELSRPDRIHKPQVKNVSTKQIV